MPPTTSAPHAGRSLADLPRLQPHSGCAASTAPGSVSYYTLGHLARFVKPGAVRIASTSFGTTGWNGQIMDVAFRNPDGSTVLVAHNENDNPSTFAVREGDQAFTYTLPGGALATFTWRGDIPGTYALRQAGPDGWTAAANPAGPADPCCTGDVAANAVDGDASTRYSTGEGQAPGQYLQVDFGSTIHAGQIVFDTGAYAGLDSPSRPGHLGCLAVPALLCLEDRQRLGRQRAAVREGRRGCR